MGNRLQCMMIVQVCFLPSTGCCYKHPVEGRTSPGCLGDLSLTYYFPGLVHSSTQSFTVKYHRRLF
jgi:hypothetical protein